MKNFISPIVIGISIIIATIVLGAAYKSKFTENNKIVVTGLGEENFDSDLIVWSGTFNRKNMELKTAYDNLNADRETIKAYLISKGISEKELVFSSINISKEFDYTYQDGNIKNSTFTGYRLSQQVEIESHEVQKIEDISREVSELINKGVEFYSQNPQYYFTKLAQLKIKMIADATKDAYSRAKKIAENGGSTLSGLKNADMGVFQITAQNSNEEFSWGGTYNTASRRKTATITMRIEYGVK